MKYWVQSIDEFEWVLPGEKPRPAMNFSSGIYIFCGKFPSSQEYQWCRGSCHDKCSVCGYFSNCKEMTTINVRVEMRKTKLNRIRS